MPSPIPAVTEPSTRHQKPPEPIAVEVWVDTFQTDPSPFNNKPRPPREPGWFPGVLAEWTHFGSHGWTGWVRYSLAPGENLIGRFLAEHIRKADGEPAGPTEATEAAETSGATGDAAPGETG